MFQKPGGIFSKLCTVLLSTSMVTSLGIALPPVTTLAATSYTRQMEALDRGVVAVKVSNGVFLSWRLLGTDDPNTSFNIYRNGTRLNNTPITNKTNYVDTSGNANSTYVIKTVLNGVEQTQSDQTKVLSNNYLDVPINKPANMTMPDGSTCSYSANDASIGDLDGDGEYEIVLKWDPSNSKDNSQSGYTGNVYLDAYKLDGTQLWRIDLGKNIRAGAHYTQFMVYDLDGDGKAEVACKTADGTVDGQGTVIGDASKDYRNSKGYILSGPEYLSVFNGQTGKAITTIDYTPARGTVSSWGDKYGNRVDRFLAGIAYLDGKTPSLIMCRGYYTRAVIVAYKFDGSSLKRQWTFDSSSSSSGNSNVYGQGNHNLSIADADGDGYDEIIYGSAAIDHNGKYLYSTGLGHGDAMHVGDFDPNKDGLEVFQVHEDQPYTEIHSAATGKIYWKVKASDDVGRGLIGNFGSDYSPYIAFSSAGTYNSSGSSISSSLGSPNFAIWWDGDLYRELLDRTYINKYNASTKKNDRVITFSDVTSCNSTKATPSLQADFFGDWREEVMFARSDSSALRIYTTTTETDTRFYTFMHDPIYRLGIAWQNVAYNQPPHTSFYIGPNNHAQPVANIYTPGNYKEPAASSSGTTTKPTITGATLENGATYMIKNAKSGLYLDVAGGSAANGTNVQQWGATSASNYNTWKAVAAGDGYYKLYSMVGDGSYLLDVANNSANDLTNIQIWQDTNCDAQLFKFYKTGSNTYAILTKTSQDASCLEAYASGTSSGTNIDQYAYNGGAHQLWTLEKVTLDNTNNNNSGDNTDNDDNTPTTPSTSDLSVVLNNSGSDSTNTLNPSLTIKTNGTTYDLSKLKVRYYYTADSTVDQNSWVDIATMSYTRDPWYTSIYDNTTAKIVKMASPTSTADSYVEFSFSGDYELDTTATLQISSRICKVDWSNYTQSNDYSYNNVNHVAVFYNNTLVGGTLPN